MLAISIPIVVTDLRFRRIPNWTCVVLFLAGIVASVFERGVSGMLWSLGGAWAGLLAFLIFYALGGMGGGDIKLMAACGLDAEGIEQSILKRFGPRPALVRSVVNH